MPRSATRLESGGAAGFRRLGYKNAMNPRDMRALLDPQGDDAPYSLERLTNSQRDALESLDWLAEYLFSRAAHERLCAKEVEFALGLDKQDKIERLRAIVARAFWRADSYANALAQSLDDAAVAKSLVEPLNAFFEAFAGNKVLLRAALDILDRRSFERATEKQERRAAITDGVAAFDLMRLGLGGVVESLRQTGATPEDARFFFLLRLAEVFVIWTRRAPDFYYQRGITKFRKKMEWLQLSTNALKLCGLGADRLDSHFRRLRGTGPRAEAYRQYANYHDLVAGLAQGLGASFEWTTYIIEWELDPPNIKPDSRTAALREGLYRELNARELTLENVRDLRKDATKSANGAEIFLGSLLGIPRAGISEQGKGAPKKMMPGLANIFYSGEGLFCGGELPSSTWLNNLGLAPEPEAYDD